MRIQVVGEFQRGFQYVAGHRLPSLPRLNTLWAQAQGGVPASLTADEVRALLCAARFIVTGTSALFPTPDPADPRFAGQPNQTARKQQVEHQ